MFYNSHGNLGKLKHSATVEFGAPIEYTVYRITPERPDGVLLTKTMFNDMNVSHRRPHNCLPNFCIALQCFLCMHSSLSTILRNVWCHINCAHAMQVFTNALSICISRNLRPVVWKLSSSLGQWSDSHQEVRRSCDSTSWGVKVNIPYIDFRGYTFNLLQYIGQSHLFIQFIEVYCWFR